MLWAGPFPFQKPTVTLPTPCLCPREGHEDSMLPFVTARGLQVSPAWQQSLLPQPLHGLCRVLLNTTQSFSKSIRNEMACPELTLELTLPQASAKWSTWWTLLTGAALAEEQVRTHAHLSAHCASALQPVSGQDRVHPMLLLVSDSEKPR